MPPEAKTPTILPAPAALAETLRPTALTPETLARTLTAAGGKAVMVDMVQAATPARRWASAGGINLVELMAWLEQELAQT
jgi:hypothetical protein